MDVLPIFKDVPIASELNTVRLKELIHVPNNLIPKTVSEVIIESFNLISIAMVDVIILSRHTVPIANDHITATTNGYEHAEE